MTGSNEKSTETLNHVIQICEDGAKGFTSAAEGVQDAMLRTLFEQYARERAQFASELQQEVQKIGGSAKDSGTMAGALHRGWIGLKAAVTSKDDHAILVECERGEDAAKDAYEKAVQEQALPSTALAVIQRQWDQVKQAHDKVKALRDRQGSIVR